jgi:two-component system OmpR family sensor kinase
MTIAAPPQPPVTATRRGLAERTSLRVKLVVALVGLSAIVLLITGLVATAALRAYLLDQVDNRLVDTARSLANQIGQPGPQRDLFAPPGYYIEVRNAAGNVISEPPPGVGADKPVLGDLDSDAVDDLGPRPYTAKSTIGAANWRVLARPVDDQLSLVVATTTEDVQDSLRRLVFLQVGIGGVALVGLGLLGSVVVRRSLRPLDEIEQVAGDIAAGDLARRVPEPDEHTEVGRLAGALNGMLARIEQAVRDREAAANAARQSEERMRRFVADASHELRTPLTSIRGFAELYRQGAVPAGEEADRVMGRIESEARRMNVLVEDLLQLARLDQSRPFVAAPVDLVTLLVDAAYDARAVAPDREFRVETGGAPHAVVLGDEVRLRQVLGNLVSNAITHTPPGSPVDLRLSTAPGEVVVEVVDRGPGLSEDQVARVFERFYRVDAARSRLAGGSGLGLAIVHAIVLAHRGRIEVATTPGGGATFRVHLPIAGVAPPPPPLR